MYTICFLFKSLNRKDRKRLTMISVFVPFIILFSLISITLTSILGGILQKVGRKTVAKVIYVFSIIEAPVLYFVSFTQADYNGFISMRMEIFVIIVLIMIAIALADVGVIIKKKIDVLEVFEKVIYIMTINLVIMLLVLAVGIGSLSKL